MIGAKPPLAFVKLYGQRLLNSSLLLEPTHVFKLFVCMLAAVDEDGFLGCGGVPALAHMTNLPLRECEDALAVLESPDPHSQNPLHEGRRVERVAGGWRVLNAVSYRETQTAAQAKGAARQRRYVRRQRELLRGAAGDELPPDDAYESGEQC